MGFPEHSHPHSDLTGKIIGAAHAVHRALRPGLDEKLYENALCIEFEELGLPFEQQKEFRVDYKERYIGKLIPDLIVADRVLVDAKVVTAFNDTHISQILGYLNITGLKVGLLINFKHASVQVKRISNQQDHQSQSAKSAVNLPDPPAPSES